MEMYPVFRSLDDLLQCENFPKNLNSLKYGKNLKHLSGPVGM